MDEVKLFSVNENEAQNKSDNTKNKTEVENEIQNEEFDSSNENQILGLKLEPESKRICKEREDYPDFKLEKDEDEGLCQGTNQVISETSSSQYASTIAHQAPDGLDCFSGETNKDVRKEMKKNPRTVKRIRFISKDGKILKTINVQSKYLKVLTKNKRFTSKMNKCIKISNEKDLSHAIAEDLENSKPEVTEIGKTKAVKIKSSMIKPSAASGLEFQSADTSKDASAVSYRKKCLPKRPSKSPKVASAEQVLAHFRWFMQSKEDSFDRNIKDDSHNQDMKADSESEIKVLNHYTETAVESVNQDLIKPSPDTSDYVTSKESGIDANDTLDIQGDDAKAVVKTTKDSPKQRIIYDQKIEYIRWWVIQQIKDREIMLKFRIMEGKYADDLETKLKCIEKAKHIQAAIDAHFDALDDNEKLLNISKRMRVGLINPEKYVPTSTIKSEKDVKPRAVPIKTFTSLFLYLFKFSQFDSENKDVFEWINPKKLISEFYEYAESKVKLDGMGKMSEYAAKSSVDDFYQALLQCHSRIKCTIPPPENRSIEDYQNYINNLKAAIDDNLECLYSLIPPATTVIFPLMSYLGHSRKKILEILAFLDQERPKVFNNFSFKYQRITETSLLSAVQHSGNSDEPKKMKGESVDNLPVFHSTCPTSGSVLKENRQRVEDIKDANEFLSRKNALNPKIDDSNQSPPQKKKYVCEQSSSPIEKRTVKGPSILRQSPCKSFSPDLFKLPLTNQMLAESLPLVSACGFFKHFMKSKRSELRNFEQHLDRNSVELQKAIRDAKTICMKLENIPNDLPSDVSALVVLAEKLMYLLSSSFRIFQKLDFCGSDMKNNLQVYSKDALDFHVSADVILEHIMENIVDKCWRVENNH